MAHMVETMAFTGESPWWNRDGRRGNSDGKAASRRATRYQTS